MRSLLTSFYAKPLALYLAAAVTVLTALVGPAEAMFLAAPSAHADGDAAAAGRSADLAKIRTTLEIREVAQRLADYGMQPDEAMAKIESLSDEQVHQLAANMDSLEAGGGVVGFVVGLAIIAALVVLIIFLLEGRIEIRAR